MPEGRYQLELIAGSVNESGYREGEGAQARFKGIRGSVQTEEGLVVTDARNYCLRLVQPSTQSTKWRTSTYAGRCQVRGFRDGRSLNARFDFPFGLVKQKAAIFVSDSINRKLRKMDTVSDEVTTIHSSDNYRPFGLVLGRMENEFFVGVQYGILRISEGKESWLVGWSNKSVQTNKATFSTAGFSEVTAIVWLGDDILLVNDLRARTVKVVNLAKQEVDVICPSESLLPTDGDIKRCSLYGPVDFFVMDNKILIGQLDGTIRTLEYQVSAELTTTTEQESTTLTNSKFCENPPSTSHANYQPLESYPEGSAVYYQCTDNYVKHTERNNKLVCTDVNGELFWIGTQIECLPSTQLVSACVLAAICVCIVISTGVTAVKLRAVIKQLEEVSGRQTRVAMETTKFTTASSEAGCSNQSFNGCERKDSCSIYKDPSQHITASPPCNAEAKPRRTKLPIPAPRHSRQTEIYNDT